MLRVFTTLLALFGTQCTATNQPPKVETVVEVEPNKLEWVDQPLSILMTAGFFPGHLYPMLGLGEELIKRGHNVTLCTTVMEGSHVIPSLPEKLGINILSAGADNLTQKDYDYVMSLFEAPGWDTVRDYLLPAPWQWTVFKVLQKVTEVNMDDFDIIVSELATVPVATYLARKGNKVVLLSSLLPGMTDGSMPEWPSPLVGFSADMTDDMTFLNRLKCHLLSFIVKPFSRIAYGDKIYQEIADYSKIMEGVSFTRDAGVSIPLIITTVMGFEYPKTSHALTHYVGPILMSSPPPIDEEMSGWLNTKEKKSVVYISMGTTAFISVKMAKALVEGILPTRYDVVWSLRKSNHDVLKEFTLEKKRFCISSWVPQQSLLEHPAVAIAILHCGMNGLQETLFHGIPVICIPYAFDQYELATRLNSFGAGIGLTRTNISAQIITNAVTSISESKEYFKQARKIRKMHMFAGGVKTAANLVEFYSDIGYNHLVPAYIKYGWSWVQYYNFDVYCLLLILDCLLIYCSYKLVKSCCRVCCSKKRKVE
ncbi:UDP-glucuronosyltransferase 2B31-like [Dysidea avara]|uniref:UDP-glucuronosyltransferase 2B31-like n=1 Tax=Dysidea avara TaxID=196820 RepID=UPI003323B0D3